LLRDESATLIITEIFTSDTSHLCCREVHFYSGWAPPLLKQKETSSGRSPCRDGREWSRGDYAPSALDQDSYFPTWILERELRSPKTLRSLKTTAMTTTAFKIDLMEPAIGMNLLMSQRITPTTIRTTTT